MSFPDRATTLAREVLFGLPGAFCDAHRAHAAGVIRAGLLSLETENHDLKKELEPFKAPSGIGRYIDELKRERNEAINQAELETRARIDLQTQVGELEIQLQDARSKGAS